MSDDAAHDPARELQQTFDRSFAEPRRTEPRRDLKLLLVQVGRQSWAIRMQDVARLEPLGRLTALPPGPEGRLGLAVVRGRLVPVFDLAALLGAAADPGERRLLLLTTGAAEVALACAALHAFVAIAEADLRPTRTGGADPGRASHEVRVGTTAWPVLDLPRMLERLLGPRSGEPAERT